MHLIAALFAGALFGTGLVISGMTQPGKVIGFLDFTGAWDPSLAFVMAGAICVFAPTFFFAHRRTSPLLTASFDLPTKTAITWQLIAGASIFGFGWGLSGFCPGPAIISIPTGSTSVLTVVGGMVLGTLLTWSVQTSRTVSPAEIPRALLERDRNRPM